MLALQAILTYLKTNGHLPTKKLIGTMLNVKKQTVRRYIRKLCELGFLEGIGVNNYSYRLSEKTEKKDFPYPLSEFFEKNV